MNVLLFVFNRTVPLVFVTKTNGTVLLKTNSNLADSNFLKPEKVDEPVYVNLHMYMAMVMRWSLPIFFLVLESFIIILN